MPTRMHKLRATPSPAENNEMATWTGAISTWEFFIATSWAPRRTSFVFVVKL